MDRSGDASSSPPLLPPFFHPCLPSQLPPYPSPSLCLPTPPFASPFVSFFPRLKFQIKTIRWSKRSLTPRAQTGKLIPSLRRKTVAMRQGRKIEGKATATVCSCGVGAAKPGSLHRRGNSLRLDIRPWLRRLVRRSHGQAAQTAERARLLRLLFPNAFNGRICGIKDRGDLIGASVDRFHSSTPNIIRRGFAEMPRKARRIAGVRSCPRPPGFEPSGD